MHFRWGSVRADTTCYQTLATSLDPARCYSRLPSNPFAPRPPRHREEILPHTPGLSDRSGYGEARSALDVCLRGFSPPEPVHDPSQPGRIDPGGKSGQHLDFPRRQTVARTSRQAKPAPSPVNSPSGTVPGLRSERPCPSQEPPVPLARLTATPGRVSAGMARPRCRKHPPVQALASELSSQRSTTSCISTMMTAATLPWRFALSRSTILRIPHGSSVARLQLVKLSRVRTPLGNDPTGWRGRRLRRWWRPACAGNRTDRCVDCTWQAGVIPPVSTQLNRDRSNSPTP